MCAVTNKNGSTAGSDEHATIVEVLDANAVRVVKQENFAVLQFMKFKGPSIYVPIVFPQLQKRLRILASLLSEDRFEFIVIFATVSDCGELSPI
jgi:hypothetical protein